MMMMSSGVSRLETQAGVAVSCTMYPEGARVLMMPMLYPDAMVWRSWQLGVRL